MCDAAGVRLEYLPPYSPDLHPIETSFSQLKSWMRRKSVLAEAYAESGKFADFIVLAIHEFQKEMDMEGPWRLAGFI